MVNYREILRLKGLGYSQRQIASGARSSHHTVREALDLAERHGLSWPLNDDVTNEEIEHLFHPERHVAKGDYEEPDYAYIHNELARPGVTLTLLWNEYCARCHDAGRAPYMSTQFCDKYRKWARLTRATMRILHKPGDAMQVDWAGNTVPYYDSVTGAESAAYLFVAVLTCSCYAYVEACADMKLENWLLCHVHAYRYFGGTTRLLIPDNLKVGVISNTRYETVLNQSYQELAEHYGTAIVPTRVQHPKDKGLAEGTVKFASTWIIAALREQRFFNMQEVQAAVALQLEELNRRPFQKREGSRHSAYLEEEKSFMRPLPAASYEPSIWTQASVGNDYLITDGGNQYSVPFDLIGEKVQIRMTRAAVEVFYKGNRVAAHKREQVPMRDPIVKREHMPLEHRKYADYNADAFMSWATSIGPKTTAVVRHFLHASNAPEQGFKACVSLIKQGDRYGSAKLEAACESLMNITSNPTIRNIATILKNRSSQSAPSPGETVPDQHGITRGAAYFGKGGDSK